MLALLPLMRWGPKLRVWSVMLASSVVTWWLYGPAWYLAIDLVAAVLITARPRGTAQRAIAFLYVGMGFFHIGFLLSAQTGGANYTAFMVVLGWLQWLILLSWGVRDAFRDSANLRRWFDLYLPDPIKAHL